MIGNALERVIVRTLVGVLAERGLWSVEQDQLVTILLNANLVERDDLALSAISSLKHAEILQNGRGTKVNLSGVGLTLGASIALPSDISSELRAAVEKTLGPCSGNPNAPAISVEV